MGNSSKRVVVLGAGFGGLTFCQSLVGTGAALTLIDRENHHLFQPLLYQVATAGLSAPEIAQPIRSILSGRDDVDIQMAAVEGIDLEGRRVITSEGSHDYDYLVIGLGGVTSYFGHAEWEEHAPGLKSLDDAVGIRRQVLLAFERAENETDPVRRKRLMTIVVIGGGPTGVELAGAFAELTRRVLEDDFRRIDPRQARVVLIEGGDRVLGHLPPDLSDSAHRQLEQLGVEVITGARVQNLEAGKVITGEFTIEAENILWAAGVSGSPLTKSLGVELDRAGRIKVNPDLSVPGHPEVFAVGDIAHVLDPGTGELVPGVSPAAIQMARHVAQIIGHELEPGADTHRPAFRYWDKGTMATIGRSAAVAKVGPLEFSGLLAWLAWLLVHLVFLVGFRNKAAVLLQWMYSYFAYKRGARIIFGGRLLKSEEAHRQS